LTLKFKDEVPSLLWKLEMIELVNFNIV